MDTATTPPKFITAADVEEAVNRKLREIVQGIEDNADYVSDDPATRVEFMREIGIPEHLIPSHEVQRSYTAQVTVTFSMEVDVDDVTHESDADYYEIEDAISEILNEEALNYFDIPCDAEIENVTVDNADVQ